MSGALNLVFQPPPTPITIFTLCSVHVSWVLAITSKLITIVHRKPTESENKVQFQNFFLLGGGVEFFYRHLLENLSQAVEFYTDAFQLVLWHHMTCGTWPYCHKDHVTLHCLVWPGLAWPGSGAVVAPNGCAIQKSAMQGRNQEAAATRESFTPTSMWQDTHFYAEGLSLVALTNHGYYKSGTRGLGGKWKTLA